MYQANTANRRLFARKGEAAPTNGRTQEFGQGRPVRTTETVAQDPQSVLGSSSPLSFLIHRKGRPTAKPSPVSVAPVSTAPEPPHRAPEVRPANGRPVEVVESPRREPTLAVPSPSPQPAQADSRPAPQPVQAEPRPAFRPAPPAPRPVPQPASEAPRPAVAATVTSRPQAAAPAAIPAKPVFKPRAVPSAPQTQTTQATQTLRAEPKDHPARRKMTVRLDWQDFRRCRQLVESRGLTYQRVIEIAVRRYLDAIFPRPGGKG